MATLSLGAVAGSNNTEPSVAWTLLSSSTLYSTHAYYSSTSDLRWISDDGGKFMASTAWCWPGAGNLLWTNSNPKTNNTWDAVSNFGIASPNNGWFYDAGNDDYWFMRVKSPYDNPTNIHTDGTPTNYISRFFNDFTSINAFKQGSRLFFVGGTGGTDYSITSFGIRYSDDAGVTHTTVTSASTVGWDAPKVMVGDGGNNLLVIGNKGKYWYSTNNGTSWTGGQHTNAAGSQAVNAVYGNGIWMLLYSDNRLYRSTNLTSWTEYALSNGMSASMYTGQGDVADIQNKRQHSFFYDGSRFICGGHTSYFHYSTDGTSWTAFPSTLKNVLGTTFALIAYSPTLNYYLALENYENYRPSNGYTQYVAKKNAWTNDITI